METRILGTTEADIRLAAEMIQKGGLVAFPTETVYGLGADALNAEAVGKVYAAKGRPSDNPMIVHIAQKSDMNKLTDGITPEVERLMEAFWPGPLTMVVPAKDVIPKVTTGGLATVGVRMPEDGWGADRGAERESVRQTESDALHPCGGGPRRAYRRDHRG